MTEKFDYFILFAEMRTGSNFLESNLNAFSAIGCHGEAFNPVFVGGANRQEMFGIDLATREADPFRLIERMRAETTGIAGFRFFHDHDPRVFDKAMADPRCAKIVLTRNMVDSYVSRKIAQATDQWRLGDMKNAQKATVDFDPEEFDRMVNRLKAFQLRILRGLQTTGQTAFYVDYEDIQDLEVINGLARFLGVEEQLSQLSGAYKKQNPEALSQKVNNFEVLEQTLAKVDAYDLGRIPNFEPRRGAIIPTYVTAAKAPALFMPVPGGPDAEVRDWLAALDGETVDALGGGYGQKTLRQWNRKNPGHRSFTVLRHPVARLHSAFCRHFLGDGPEVYTEIRRYLVKALNLPVPMGVLGDDYDLAAHRRAFLGFADFVKGSLGGQTGIRVDGSWASQTEVIRGFSQFMLPDHILREDRLAEGLGALAGELGRDAPLVGVAEPDSPFDLAKVYDEEIESRVRAIYQRDYMMFGFGPWK